MPTPNQPLDHDALVKLEVERAVAPYKGRVPAFMLAKLRELAERHWRESPTAIESINRRLRKQQAQSGDAVVPGKEGAAQDDADQDDADQDDGSKETP